MAHATGFVKVNPVQREYFEHRLKYLQIAEAGLWSNRSLTAHKRIADAQASIGPL